MAKESKDKALKSKLSPKKVAMKKVHVSDDFCSTCGAKMSRMERYESGHNHYDD